MQPITRIASHEAADPPRTGTPRRVDSIRIREPWLRPRQIGPFRRACAIDLPSTRTEVAGLASRATTRPAIRACGSSEREARTLSFCCAPSPGHRSLSMASRRRRGRGRSVTPATPPQAELPAPVVPHQANPVEPSERAQRANRRERLREAAAVEPLPPPRRQRRQLNISPEDPGRPTEAPQDEAGGARPVFASLEAEGICSQGPTSERLR